MKKLAATAAALGLGAALSVVAPVAPAHADPCFFGTGEFSNWYDGARWGATRDTVENVYANCVGTWDTYTGSWNGHPTKRRVWARADGGTTEMVFAKMDDGLYHAHDNASTYKYGSDLRHVCEWPRPDGNPCSPS